MFFTIKLYFMFTAKRMSDDCWRFVRSWILFAPKLWQKLLKNHFISNYHTLCTVHFNFHNINNDHILISLNTNTHTCILYIYILHYIQIKSTIHIPTYIFLGSEIPDSFCRSQSYIPLCLFVQTSSIYESSTPLVLLISACTLMCSTSNNTNVPHSNRYLWLVTD